MLCTLQYKYTLSVLLITYIKYIPAVSHNPRLIVLPSTTTFALKLSKTVGTQSCFFKIEKVNFFVDQAHHIQRTTNHALPYRGKSVAGVRDEHTGLSHGSISHSNTLDESCCTHFQVPLISSPHITSKLPLTCCCFHDFEFLRFFQLKNWKEK